MSMAAFLFEALIGVLLVGAAVMCWRVDRRLKALRDGQDGLKETIGALNDAVDRARAGLAALDRASRESGDVLEQRTREARALADELRLLTSSGETRLDRFERPRRPQAASELPRERADDGAPRVRDPLKALR
ncbi:MAG: DUF6468 domain-containing protein [Caulobacterales bacterium]|uniref:DUF6468 domain-containing protein n=1 Tax=Glycocaulis sp. TaxID=1969725 RepID=UPI003F9EEC80